MPPSPPAIAEDTAAASRPPSRRFLTALVTLTFLMNAVGRGVTETFAVFLLPVELALGVDRAAIAATYSIYMLAYGVAAPFAGQLIDRLGARLCYASGLLCLSAGYLLAGMAETIWHYYLTAGVLGGIGAAALGMVAASSLLTRWFTRGLGLMSALPYAAIGAGMLVFPPIAQVLIDGWGWRLASQMLGAATLAVLPIVVVLPLARFTAGSDRWRQLRTRSRGSAERSPWPLGAAVRTRAFAALFLAYFATSVAAYSVLPHSVAYLVEQGIAPLAAAGAFGLNGLMSTLGIIAMGWLSDRIGRLPTVTISYLSTMAGVAALMLVAFVPSMLLVYAFVLLFGLMQGARGPILVSLVAKIFAGGSVGAIFGALSLALGLGAAAGSWLSGLLHQWTGNYMASFALSLAGALTGLATFWLARTLRRESN